MHFKTQFNEIIEEEENREHIFVDLNSGESIENEDNCDKIFRYLMNVRTIAVIVANIFWNQIKLIIRERVIYDRELFNYEEYY